MKRLRRQISNVAVALLCSAAALFAGVYEVWSQTGRIVKVVVAAPPGGASDILARLLAEQIGRARAVTMMVENRPGASTAIGTDAVARAAPDGNTLLIVTPSFVINSQLRKLTYGPLTSFEPICNLVQSPQLIVVNSASPYRTLGELLRAAQTKPGGLTMAGAGPATGLHIAFEMLKRAAKVDMTFVPYPGDAAAVNALLGEHVASVFAPYPGIKEQLNAGNLRALATASRERAKALPSVQTFAEAGYGDVEADIWQGIVAPANTPKETIARLADWFTAALLVPEVRLKLVPLGLYPAGTCGADFAALLRKQYDDFGRAIREANIKAD
jgi:tripartite-type tricarboxylate transporter receptor subunit TctC